MKYILVSESLERQKLLSLFGIVNFAIEPHMGVEYINRTINPLSAIKKIAKDKALYVIEKYKNYKGDFCVISAKTLIAFNGEIYGKFKNIDEAYKVLRSFSASTHSVITSIYVYVKENGEVREAETYDYTNVTFNEIPEEKLKPYVLIGGYNRKTGGYALNGDIGNFVADIEGSITNAFGLSLEKLTKLFKKLKLKKQINTNMDLKAIEEVMLEERHDLFNYFSNDQNGNDEEKKETQ